MPPSDVTKLTPVDSKYGLPTISLDSGKPDTQDRSSIRAPMLTGGTVTGKTFQTDAVNPRIVLDSTQFAAYNTTGQNTVKIDVATGQVDLLFGAGVNPTLRWVDTSGVVQAQIKYDASFLGVNAWVAEAKTMAAIMAHDTIGAAYNVAPVAWVNVRSDSQSVHLYASAAGNSIVQTILNAGFAGGAQVTQILSAALATQAEFGLDGNVGATNYLTVKDATARFRFSYDPAAHNAAVDYIGGNILFTNPVQSTIAPLGHFLSCGHRDVAVAAGQAFGNGLHWRHLTTNAGGTAYVTPTVATFTASVSTNANTLQIRFISYYGGMFTCNSIAAGIVEWYGFVTMT